MWLQVFLCFLVGFAYASQQPAWKENTEYIYEVRGRTLTSLDQISNDYAGIFLKAQLSIWPQSNGNLNAQISQLQYAQMHAKLNEGWEEHIPDSKLSYRELEFSSRPFQIVMNNGAITDLIVSKDISNWKANIIKSIVSQFQLDTKSENVIPSHINLLTQERSNTAIYKTMEETVTGISETLYEIHPLPEYILQTEPWLVPLRQLKENGKVMEIVKSKNFTYSEKRPSYHFGFDGIEDFELNNKIGDFFTRSSISRAVITGTLERFFVQSSVTVDRILMSPTLDDKQRGSVNTMVNVTLLSVKQETQPRPEISSPVAVGLVYKYNNPFSNSNEPHSREHLDYKNDVGSAEAGYSDRRKTNFAVSSEFSDSSISDAEKGWQQKQPKLHEAPESPLLPFTVGFDGQSIKKQQNIVENARKLAQSIASELLQPESIPQKNTVGKFVVLTSLLRVMDQSEMLQFASQMYTQQKSGVEATAWKISRDSVAQTGTGPALLIMQEWIKTKKFEPEEAAEIICTATKAARQPTEKYMEVFYDVIQSEEVMSKSGLNESAILCYTTLVHKVYVNKNDTYNKYPVHSFGPFNTEKGEKMVIERLIPDLSRKLNEAVASGNTQNIHLYIRALGNVGHRRILEAFEPYLEGRKQASQFQRLLMVVALDKLAENNPKVARSVLYRIYQNTNEDEQVRVAAVCQLMKANPSSSMLQRMASHTNVDTNEYVNAAVKSTIETAAESEEPEYSELRSAARSAKPLLTPREYGVEYSHNKLRSFVVKHLQQSYKESTELFGSSDFFWPKGLKYKLRGQFGGLKQQVINMQAMVSSLDDLITVLKQQTQKYQQEKRQKQVENSAQYKLSSEYVAKFLKMENVQREQLEGGWYLQMSDLEKFWSFDNRTIENLPEVLRQLEEELRSGKPFDYTKMVIQNEAALSFPTELGLPFIYTYDRPTLIKLQGKIKAKADPQISTGNLFFRPDSISSEFEIHALISGRTQSHFGFFSPFDHQRYSAGYDKNFQVMIPLSGNIQADLRNNQFQVELENPNGHRDVKLLHYSTLPYTAQNDIYNPTFEKKIISRKHPRQINTVLGKKSTGIAFRVQMSSEQPIDGAFMYEKLRQHNLISAMLSPWLDDNIQHTEINVEVDAEQSPTKKIVIETGFKYAYDERKKSGDENTADINRFSKVPDEPLQRQAEFMTMASFDVSNSLSHVVDASVKFSGTNQIIYIATVAASKSNVVPKGRLLLQLKKHDEQDQPQTFYLSAKGHFPNTNGLDMAYSMQMDPTSTVQIQAAFGESESRSAKINAEIEFSKSEERQLHLREQPEYDECQRQMQEGNHQLPACAKMTVKANLLNHVKANIVYHDFDPQFLNQTYKLYSVLRQVLYPTIEENILLSSESKSLQNRLNIETKFYPDLKAVNFSINFSIDNHHGKVQARDVEVNEWVRDMLVSHPVFDIKSRMMGHVLKYDTYKPSCVVDEYAVSTFDNKTYPLSLGNDWTVQLQYVPRRPSSNKNEPQQSVPVQLNEEIESYVVLVRAWPQDLSKKEIKIMIQSPNTKGKLVEITLKPRGPSQFPRLFVSNEDILYDKDIGSNFYDNYMQVYSLPNNEVKVDISDAFYVIYDGVRAKLTVVDSKFKDAARGLCGTFTREEQTDFLSPANCIVKTPEEFVSSYTLFEGPRMRLRNSDQEGECYQKKVAYVDVISSRDVGRNEVKLPNRRCTMHQTQYVLQGDEICFTLRQMPVCKSGCQQRGTVFKKIPVHCAQSSRATNLWRSQIDKGNSPDFSMKPQTKKITMEVPTRCLP